MYAIICTGGKQYKVAEGQTLRLEKVLGEVGTTVSFDRVLMASDREAPRIGQPTLPGVTVTGRIVEQGKAKKVIVFKYKRRKGYRRKKGHRQHYTALKIDAIKDVDRALKEQ